MNAAVEVLFVERDGRAMNNMDPETKLTHIRLEEWARWAKDSESREWPPITLLGKVIEQGISGAGQGTRPPISMPDNVAKVDAAVAKLGEIDKKAIKTYYMRWEDIDSMARRLHMRRRQFQNVLRRARFRVQVYMSVMA